MQTSKFILPDPKTSGDQTGGKLSSYQASILVTSPSYKVIPCPFISTNIW